MTIAATVPVEKGKQNPLMPFVEAIQLFSDESIEGKGKPKPLPEPTPEDIAEGRAFVGRVEKGSWERMRGLFGHGFTGPRE